MNTQTISLLPMANMEGEIAELVDTINKMLSRIKASAQEREYFFSAAAHELKTPLSVMRTELEIALFNKNIPASAESILQSQLDEVRRLQRIIEGLLTVNISSTTQKKITPEEVELAGFTQTICQTLSNYARQNETAIEFNQPSQEISVQTDRQKLEHILSNILDNAIKHGQPGQKIIVSIVRRPTVIIQVVNRTDDKTGNSEVLKKAFYKKNPLDEGYGIGLWLAQQFAEMLQYGLKINWKEHRFTVTLILSH